MSEAGGAAEAGGGVTDATPDREVADMTGPAAMPRKNGELVFESAWAGRAFGMTLALHHARVFHWNDFRDRLIAEIAEAERHGSESSTYYERWLAAFERLLTEQGLIDSAELDRRTAEFECGHRDDVF
jgi:nitrile hydratase accessory protein